MSENWSEDRPNQPESGARTRVPAVAEPISDEPVAGDRVSAESLAELVGHEELADEVTAASEATASAGDESIALPTEAVNEGGETEATDAAAQQGAEASEPLVPVMDADSRAALADSPWRDLPEHAAELAGVVSEAPAEATPT